MSNGSLPDDARHWQKSTTLVSRLDSVKIALRGGVAPIIGSSKAQVGLNRVLIMIILRLGRAGENESRMSNQLRQLLVYQNAGDNPIAQFGRAHGRGREVVGSNPTGSVYCLMV